MVHKVVERKMGEDSLMVHDQAVFDKFALLFQHAGGNPAKVNMVFAIDNPRQRVSFENYRKDLTAKHSDNEELFRKEDWRQLSKFSLRNAFLLRLASQISEFRTQFNDGGRVTWPISPFFCFVFFLVWW